MLGTSKKTRRKPFSSAVFCSCDPGSVIATKFRATALLRAADVIHQDARLERRPRFAGHDKNRARDIVPTLETSHDRDRWNRARAIEDSPAPAHAEEQDVIEACLAKLPAELLKGGGIAQLRADDVEPAEPVVFVAASPQ
jgi:hypothetical protein